MRIRLTDNGVDGRFEFIGLGVVDRHDDTDFRLHRKRRNLQLDNLRFRPLEFVDPTLVIGDETLLVVNVDVGPGLTDHHILRQSTHKDGMAAIGQSLGFKLSHEPGSPCFVQSRQRLLNIRARDAGRGLNQWKRTHFDLDAIHATLGCRPAAHSNFAAPWTPSIERRFVNGQVRIAARHQSGISLGAVGVLAV